MSSPYDEMTMEQLQAIRYRIQVADSERDENGQPPRHYYRKRVEGRQIAEMLGMARGILADGIVSDLELRALLQWFQEHPDIAYAFPGDIIAKRLLTAFADQHIDDEERADLQSLLGELIGDDDTPPDQLDRPTRLAFDDPPPTLMFESWEYVVTGKFAYGPRRKVEEAISNRGGRLSPRITNRTDVLVIGTFSSNAWLESTHGTKVLDALEVRSNGFPIRIVPESHWYKVVQLDE